MGLHILYTRCIVDSMNAQMTLLGFLEQESNYGYELKKLYDVLFGQEKPILSGQVYSTLSRLKRDEKIIELTSSDPSHGPDRVKYQITQKGSEAFRRWLERPEDVSPSLQTTLYFKTVLAIMNYGDAAAYLDTQRHAHIERMRELVRLRRETTIAAALLIDNALFHIEADLRWIDLTSSRLTKLKEELCL